MVYEYVAYNEKKEIIKGKLTAKSEELATELLSYVGYKVVNLKPFVPFFSVEKLLPSLFRCKSTEIILFYRELALLIESGINIVTSLELLQSQATNRILKRVLGEVVADLRSGSQFSAALNKHSDIFSTIYCQLVAVGEQTGSLETVLRQIASYMEKDIVATKNIKSALMYPIITFIVTVIVVGILVTYVLPSFGSLYSSLGVELPATTRLLIDTAKKAQDYGVYILLGALMMVGAVYLYVRTPEGKYKWDKLFLKLPLVGRVSQLGELSRYCRSMSLLFKAGLPLTEAMNLVIRSSNNKVTAKALIEVQKSMVKGEGLSRPMSRNKLFLPLMVQMVRVGEETGNLDTTLLAVAQNYEEEAEDKTRSLIALIQPAMTLFIGGVIGVIALSLTSAMYSIYGKGF